jgi:iron complex transport system substrate-binding protein
MLRLPWRAALLLACSVPSLQARAEEASVPPRTIALGSGVAETICVLGACESLIAVDQSANGLASVATLPQVGYFRALSLEPLLALAPERVVASSLAGPPAVLEGLARAGVEVVSIDEEPTATGLIDKLDAIARAVDLPEAGQAMAEQTRATLEAVSAALAGSDERPTAVYLLGMSGAGLNAAGRNTLADGLMEMAGLSNAFADAEGYKALSPEMLVSLRPDFILVGERTLAAIGGEAGLQQQPALVGTLVPGGSQLLRHDDAHLLGLGPHTAAELVRIVVATRPDLAEALSRYAPRSP